MTNDNNNKAGDGVMGGVIDQPAFCLLDGMVEDPMQGKVPFRLPINRLPANLGRTHVPTENADHFFGLGKQVKALSRLQCQIEFRTNQGSIGPIGDPTVPGDASKEPKLTPSKINSELLHNPTKEDLSDPLVGHFVVTCLGKNPIKVNGQRVEQNESCVLVHGSAVRISAFNLYFLLPEEDPEMTLKTLELPDEAEEALTTSAGADHNSKNPPTKKKRPRPSALALDTVSSSEPTLAGGGGSKKLRGNAWNTIQEQLDDMATDELLAQLSEASEHGLWDRRAQFMGATVAYRAVREAAQSDELQQKAEEMGVAKSEIVEWIQNSERFKSWTDLMSEKLEPKSYQSSISKAMARAGYERINLKNFGRHVRWYLPKDCHDNPNRHKIYLESKKFEAKGKGGNDNDEEGGAEKDDDNEAQTAAQEEDGGGSETPAENPSGAEQDDDGDDEGDGEESGADAEMSGTEE